MVKKFTMREVSAHDTPSDCWTVVHGKVLNVTDFVESHPGGRNLLLLAAGIDATVLFESYHLRGVRKEIVDRYVVGELDTKVKSFYDWGEDPFNPNPKDFYPTLKRRVYEALQASKTPRRGGVELHVKAALILITLVVSWFFGWFHRPNSMWLRVLVAAVHGFASAQVGLSIMHDANHGSFSTNSFVGKLAGYTLDLIGASSVVWSFQHVVSHHAYTNLETRTETNLNNHRDLKNAEASANDLELSHENDVDVFSSFPLVRMHPSDPKSWFHKFQHIYAPIMFAAFTMVKIVYSDIMFVSADRVSHVSMKSRTVQPDEKRIFWGFKMFNLMTMIIIPTMRHGLVHALMATFVAHLVAGELLAMMFIVNHVTEEAKFFEGSETTNLKSKKNWAKSQAESTVNWGVSSWFWNHFSGGLNHQLEHHLFPGCTHVNYVKICDVTKTTCEEFGVRYNETPTLYGAMKMMLSHLYNMGHEEGVVSSE